MIYSYTQLSHYLACPRRYRYRYQEGWQERPTRANLLFGRAFESALAAYFRREDPTDVLFREWSGYKDLKLEYNLRDTWDRMLHQGIKLLELFAQQDRIRIRRPRQNLQIKFTRPLARGNEFVAYVDAIGELDGIRCVLDWKTTTARYPEQPSGLLTLDPQLVCYSWMTGESEVAFVVFVRKYLSEIQYLQATITEEQRSQFQTLVEDTVGQIESAAFPRHSGIRFPQNGCISCSYLGLCLRQQALVDAKLIPPGGDFGWFDELDY